MIYYVQVICSLEYKYLTYLINKFRNNVLFKEKKNILILTTFAFFSSYIIDG